jgi:hypothetical protein
MTYEKMVSEQWEESSKREFWTLDNTTRQKLVKKAKAHKKKSRIQKIFDTSYFEEKYIDLEISTTSTAVRDW